MEEALKPADVSANQSGAKTGGDTRKLRYAGAAALVAVGFGLVGFLLLKRAAAALAEWDDDDDYGFRCGC